MNLEISCSWFLSCRCQAGIQRVRTQTFNEGITPSPASKHLQCFIAEAQCHCHKMDRSMADRVRLVLEVRCHLLSDPYRAVPSPLVTALQSPDNSKKRREGECLLTLRKPIIRQICFPDKKGNYLSNIYNKSQHLGLPNCQDSSGCPLYARYMPSPSEGCGNTQIHH